MENSDLIISRNIQKVYNREKKNNFYHTTKKVKFNDFGNIEEIDRPDCLEVNNDAIENDDKFTRKLLMVVLFVESLITSLLLILSYILNVEGRKYVFLQIYTVIVGAAGTYLTFMNRLSRG